MHHLSFNGNELRFHHSFTLDFLSGTSCCAWDNLEVTNVATQNGAQDRNGEQHQLLFKYASDVNQN